MLTIRELIKTLYNAFNQKLKNHRGNWEQNDPTADDYIKNRPFYEEVTFCYKWDGNITGRETYFEPDAPYGYVKITDDVLAAKDLIGATMVVNGVSENGLPLPPQAVLDSTCVIDNGDGSVMVSWGIPVIVSVNKSMNGLPSAGVYVLYIPNSATPTASIYCSELSKTNIHKLDKKFIDLPDGIITEDDLAPVATSGSYSDLSDTPTIYSDVVRYGTSQSLTDAQKTAARSNIGAVSSDDIVGVVKYGVAQSLSDSEKEIARDNIGAADEVKVEELISSAKNGILLTDETSGCSYVVSIKDGNLVTYCAVKSIEVTTMPTKTEYVHGEYFDPTGMTVMATCYDGKTKEIIDFICPNTYLAEGATSVSISYVEAGAIISTTIPVIVSAFDAEATLVDFTYTDNGDGTYTIADWKGTYNGEASTEMIIPNYGCIIL